MATFLEFTVLASDQAAWGTLEAIKDALTADPIKRLKIALDPLIDPSVNNPQEAYSLE